MATTQPLIQNPFQAAMLEFKTNLNNDKLYTKLLAVASIDEVYDLTDKLQADQGRKGHLRHLAKIEPFLNRLREYTGAIDTFVQVYPEIMGLIWGPIKLLLQWSSTLTQSFDAIVNTTADIGLLLPEFQEVVVLFSGNDKIYDVLVLFFKDILDFYQIGLKFFTMPRWKCFFEALWPRKKEHISLVKTHIERHALLMRNEVRLEHIREEHDTRLRAFEHFKNAEKSHRLQRFYAIKADMSPRMYDDKLNWYHSRVCEGTGTWLFKDDVVKDWLNINNGSSRVVWLQGIPGAGKTFLAGAVVDKAYTIGHTAFAFLSHAVSTSTSALGVLHSLLFQVASQHEDLQDVLCHSTNEQIKSNITVAVDTLKSILDCAGQVFLIVDGLDEIDEVERRVLLKQLLHLSHECHETRIFISSRREEDIAVILEARSETIRVDGRNEESIQVLVDYQLKQIFQSRRFPPQIQDEIKRSLAPLASKAKGMFLYAKIVLSGIELIDNVAEICEDLSILPEDLDDAYSRVLVRINKLRPPSARNKARRILAWVGCSPTPLTVQEIEQALMIKPESLELATKVFASPNLNRLCGPIIEIVDGYIQFVHFTVKEYLFSPGIDGHISLTHATLDLAICCTTFLSQRHYDVVTLGNDDIFTGLLLDGSYRLHYFAVNGWYELVKKYLQLTQNKPLPLGLVHCLRTLMVKRSNEQFAAERDTFFKPAMVSNPERKEQNMKKSTIALGNAASLAHKEQTPPRVLSEDTIEQDEVQALVLDLVREDEVEMVERLLPRVDDLYRFSSLLGKTVGELGSLPMAQMITRVYEEGAKHRAVDQFYHGAIKSCNVKFSDWLINSNQMPEYRDEAASITAAFVKTDSEDMWRLCEQFMAALSRADDMDRRMSDVCFEEPVINATCRVAKRESMLLSLWESVAGIKKLKAAKLSYSLGVVARTTCSIPLGRALLQYGADVNGQRGKLAVSPLQFAARKSSIENAEFMRFLLSAGADPDQVSRSRKPSDGIGAKEIVRWLGMTWNELVEQTRDCRRGASAAPPDPSGGP
ncbi:hypothetical protein ALT_4751 [Aspergillus lentulus]|uniref:NACHT domain-containing protein n=1 Tax=Aspergillus lentulus TaxID=293939 RepID=A0AAN4TAI2_ASPLE|nr:hypothetical protein ALT_4751 [Aspergillus lentulus]